MSLQKPSSRGAATLPPSLTAVRLGQRIQLSARRAGCCSATTSLTSSSGPRSTRSLEDEQLLRIRFCCLAVSDPQLRYASALPSTHPAPLSPAVKSGRTVLLIWMHCKSPCFVCRRHSSCPMKATGKGWQPEVAFAAPRAGRSPPRQPIEQHCFQAAQSLPCNRCQRLFSYQSPWSHHCLPAVPTLPLAPGVLVTSDAACNSRRASGRGIRGRTTSTSPYNSTIAPADSRPRPKLLRAPTWSPRGTIPAAKAWSLFSFSLSFRSLPISRSLS